MPCEADHNLLPQEEPLKAQKVSPSSLPFLLLYLAQLYDVVFNADAEN